MKRLSTSIIFILSILIFQFISVNASTDIVEDANTIVLHEATDFSVTLEDNSLEFLNEFPFKKYESIVINLEDKNTGKVIRKISYERSKGNKHKINLKGIADGDYSLHFIYLPVGTKDIVDAMVIFNSVESDVILRKGDFYQISTYNTDDNFGSIDGLLKWADVVRKGLKIKDYDRDGVADTFNPYFYNSYEEVYKDSYDSVFQMLYSGNLLRYEYPAFSITIKDGNATLLKSKEYIDNLKAKNDERTDEYASDFYKNRYNIEKPEYENIRKKAMEITAGITNDYEKARAISLWVSSNIEYSMSMYLGPTLGEYVHYPQDAISVLENKIAVCEGFSNLTVALLQAAGIPAKVISGKANGFLGWGPHAWTEAYVDNRWIFIDSTFDSSYGDRYFDMSAVIYSKDHIRYSSDERNLWDGSLKFYDITNDKVLKEVKNFKVDGLLESTYGFDAKDLYKDNACTVNWDFEKHRVNATGYVVFVKRNREYVVKFDTQGGTVIESIVLVALERDGYCTIPKPADPKKDGYIFMGWTTGFPENDFRWDFENNMVWSSQPTTLIAVWKKK